MQQLRKTKSRRERVDLGFSTAAMVVIAVGFVCALIVTVRSDQWSSGLQLAHRDGVGPLSIDSASRWSPSSRLRIGRDELDGAGGSVFLQRFGHAYRAYLENDLDHARELLEELYLVDPTFVPAATLLGRVAYFQREPGRVTEVLEEVLLREPNHIDAAKWLARGYLALDEVDAAEQTVRHARELSSEDPELLILLAQSALAAGKLDRALAATEQALAFRTALAEAALQIAMIYRSAGVSELGAHYLQAAAALSPVPIPASEETW